MSRRTIAVLGLAVVVCAVAAVLVVLVPGWRPIDESLSRAEQAMAGHEYLRAQTHLVEYLARWPQNARGHILLARCYRQAAEEDLESAQEHLNEAGRLTSSSKDLAFETDLLDYQWKSGPPEVEARLKGYLESRPEDRPLILEALARGCLRQRRLNAANKWLDEWVRQQPDDWWPRMWRGALFQHMSRPQLAIEDNRIVLQQRPDDPWAIKRLGVALAASGFDYQEASQLLERFLAEEPGDADGWAAMARCQRALGRTDEAYASAVRAIASDPQSPDGPPADALLTKALIELDRGEDQQALQTLGKLRDVARRFNPERAQQRLMALNPLLDNPHQTQRMEELLHLEAKALRRLGQVDQADERLQRLAQLQTDVRQLKQLLEAPPERQSDPQHMFAVAELYLQVGQPHSAESWLQRMHSVAPDDPRIPAAMKTVQQQLSASVSEAP